MTSETNIKKQIYQIIESLPVERLPDLLRFLNQFLQHSRDEDVKQSAPKQSASDFLLSMAGIFDSGLKDTSENVEAIVMDAILKKHERE
jgi:hypothetical protein